VIDHDNEKLYAQMGLATLIPGMQRMIELMQLELDRMRAQLSGLQAKPKRRGPGRPRGPLVSSGASGWPSDPEERSREMKRRQKVAAAKKAVHPRHPDHPEHAKFVAKASAAAKARWAKMSVRARKERLAVMQAGKKDKAAGGGKPTVKLEVAS
jgi:hypothetical protein